MTALYFEDHPTDPEKVILRKKPHLDKGRDYEEGFIDGMQYQMQSSVDKAVNRMAQLDQEPVAWESLLGAVARGWCYEENANKTMDSDLAVAIAKEVQALYTTPPQRKPLTDEEIYLATNQIDRNERGWAVKFARAIEAAHGIIKE